MKSIPLASMTLFTLLGAGTLTHARSIPPKQAVSHTVDIVLVQTQIRDAPDVSLADSTIYVLTVPGRETEVYKAFGLSQMEADISSLPRSRFLHYVLHYAGAPIRTAGQLSPTPAQLEALRNYCQKQGIKFLISSTS